MALVFAAFLPIAAFATDGADPSDDGYIRPSGDSDLTEFLWINRVLVVFADTPADPKYQQQIEILRDGRAMMEDRDVVVLTDTDPAARSPARTRLRPRGFGLVWVDKDGTIKLRRPSPRSVREIAASIDKTAMRAEEVRERRAERNQR